MPASAFPVVTDFLSRRQKWRLTLSLSLLYLPILLYLDDWYHSWASLWRNLPLLFVALGVGMGLLFGWLYAAEWLQSRLLRWFGEDFLLELKLPALLLTLGFSLVLAVAFLVALGSILGLLNHVLPLFPELPPGTLPGPDFLALFHRANKSFFLQLMLATFYLLATSRALLRARDFHRRTEQLETENLQAQLAALKNQVNPHFLFNSLSILTSLVHLDADLSEQFVEQLAQAYRYVLEQKDHDLVPLATELKFIEAYAFLLKIRFEEQFELAVEVPAASRARHLPPLTLQLLVENAVKHNQMSSEQPLRVHIACEDGELVVRNTLRRRPAPALASTGLGLLNIQKRYRLVTPLPVRLVEEAGEFVVRLPLLP
ncbi:histidine kinase [Hymenobacter sp. RP-2-7]|uniref:Histidine kinase n=1 Tax=Hymenobacter polaris TaxID=2682546 RepID=A0A7Y0FML0_9BACT|nr:histidine kinase [Hymenobacter polaris]NML65982.1 histidine kinase [Hymenobacter polaris]